MIFRALFPSMVFVEFRDRFFMDFGFISTPFFNMFLYFSAPLVLVIFGNTSIRNRVSCKSKSIELAHFQHVLWTSFQVGFLSDFVTFLRQVGAPFGTIFEKKPLRKSLQKKGTPHLKMAHYPRVRWLLGTPPRVRASQQFAGPCPSRRVRS